MKEGKKMKRVKLPVRTHRTGRNEKQPRNEKEGMRRRKKKKKGGGKKEKQSRPLQSVEKVKKSRTVSREKRQAGSETGLLYYHAIHSLLFILNM